MLGAPWRSMVAIGLVSGALASPAFAAPPGGGETAPVVDTRVPPNPAGAPTPTRADRAAEAALRARPAARERRRASRSAYTDLDRGEIVALAQKHYPELDHRGYRALELRAGERVDAWLGATAARVTRPGQPDVGVESQLPLRTVGA